MKLHAAKSVRALALAALLGPIGCSASDPPAPRTASSRYYNLASTPSRPVVVLGNLDNPARTPIRWRDIGEGMTDALSREMRSDGVYDAWINARVAREVRSVLEGPPAQRPARFAQLAAENPDIQYILIGRITDFQHLGEPAQRRSFTARTAPPPDPQRRPETPPPFEAIVAIDFTVVNIQEHRAVLSDHVMAQVTAGYDYSNDIYGDMAFGSYRFWATPLGQASQRAILEVMRRVDELPVPTQAPTYVALRPRDESKAAGLESNVYRDGIRVEAQLDARTLRIAAGRGISLREGVTFYVCRYDPAEGRMIAINDRDTGRPLRARIVDASVTAGTAMLMGLKPGETDLAGAMLTGERGVQPGTTAATGVNATTVPAPPALVEAGDRSGR